MLAAAPFALWPAGRGRLPRRAASGALALERFVPERSGGSRGEPEPPVPAAVPAD